MDAFEETEIRNLWSKENENGRTFLGKFQQLHYTKWGEDIDGYQSMTVVRIVNPGVVELKALKKWKEQIEEALIEKYTDREWCGHEHDCCGCVRTTVKEVFQFSSTQWVVFSTAVRNV